MALRRADVDRVGVQVAHVEREGERSVGRRDVEGVAARAELDGDVLRVRQRDAAVHVEAGHRRAEIGADVRVVVARVIERERVLARAAVEREAAVHEVDAVGEVRLDAGAGRADGQGVAAFAAEDVGLAVVGDAVDPEGIVAAAKLHVHRLDVALARLPVRVEVRNQVCSPLDLSAATGKDNR